MWPMPQPPDEVTTRQALDILGLKDPSTVIRFVREHKLAPSRKLPGASGAYLFWRSDIEALRDERAARAAAAS